MEWKIIYDADDDDGNPTTWYCKSERREVWICKYDEDDYRVENDNGEYVYKKLKTLGGCKRYAERKLL